MSSQAHHGVGVLGDDFLSRPIDWLLMGSRRITRRGSTWVDHMRSDGNGDRELVSHGDFMSGEVVGRLVEEKVGWTSVNSLQSTFCSVARSLTN